MKVAIIGGGPAGCAAAYTLQKNKVDFELFEAADGHLVLGVGNDRQFRAFCRVAGRDDLLSDERFCRSEDRVRHREVLVTELGRTMRERSREAWLTACEDVGVPCGPVRRMDEVFREPQLVHREALVEQAHASGGTVRTLANPVKFSASPVRYERPPPMLGQHTDEILTSVLGLNSGDVDVLWRSGALGASKA